MENPAVPEKSHVAASLALHRALGWLFEHGLHRQGGREYLLNVHKSKVLGRFLNVRILPEGVSLTEEPFISNALYLSLLKLYLIIDLS